MIEELAQGLRETRDEVRTLRMLIAEQGKRIAISERIMTQPGAMPEGLTMEPAQPRSLWLMAVQVVAENWYVPAAKILGRERTDDVAMARHIARHLVRRVFNADMTSVARWCGCHKKTVMWSLQQLDSAIQTTPGMAARIAKIEAQFKSLHESH